MSQIQTTDWSETAASNNQPPPAGWPENQSAASVNNCARELMSALKIEWNKTHTTISSTGSDPAYVLTYGTAPPALVNGMEFSFNANFANLGTTPTVNVNGLGAVTIQKHGAAGLTAMAAGDIQIGHHVKVEYDSSAGVMVIISPIPAATSSFTGGALSSALNEAKGADIASASTTDIGAATGNYVNVTGTTTINALGTVQAGTRRIVNFNGILTLTYNAASLILPGSASIVTAAGDTATFISLGSGNWICTQYQRRIGFFVLTVKKQTFVASGTYTPSAGMLYCLIEAVGGGGGGGGAVSGAQAQAGGGGAAQYSRVLATAATIGASKTVTIGAGGTAGANTGGTGGTGGTTSVGTVCTAVGGSGAVGATGIVNGSPGGLGGTGGTSDVASTGAPGAASGGSSAGIPGPSGGGGSTLFGGGGVGLAGASGGNGPAGTGYGGGGAGANGFGGAHTGGAGSSGAVYITEWCSQ